MKLVVHLIAFIFTYSVVSNAQNETGTVRVCHGEICPENTTYCLRSISTPKDEDYFLCELNCMDSNFTSVASFNASTPNPYSGDPFFKIDFEGISMSNALQVPANETEGLSPNFCPSAFVGAASDSSDSSDSNDSDDSNDSNDGSY